MTADKLNALIEEENARNEDRLAQRALDIIRNIADLRRQRAGIDERVKELQAELKAIEVPVLDAISILG